MNAFETTTQCEASLARKTARLGRLIHRYYQIDAREKGMDGDPLRGQGRVLALLAVKPQTTQRELSYLLDMRQQSLSELLDKLEEKGYIVRSKSPEDRRVVSIALTEAGSAAAPNLEALNSRVDVIDCLDEDERMLFEALVDKITAAIEGKLEEKGVDPHALKRGPHHEPHCCDREGHGPTCGQEDAHGHHMMRRGPHREEVPENFEPHGCPGRGRGRGGRGGHHGMCQA